MIDICLDEPPSVFFSVGIDDAFRALLSSSCMAFWCSRSMSSYFGRFLVWLLIFGVHLPQMLKNKKTIAYYNREFHNRLKKSC